MRLLITQQKQLENKTYCKFSKKMYQQPLDKQICHKKINFYIFYQNLSEEFSSPFFEILINQSHANSELQSTSMLAKQKKYSQKHVQVTCTIKQLLYMWLAKQITNEPNSLSFKFQNERTWVSGLSHQCSQFKSKVDLILKTYTLRKITLPESELRHPSKISALLTQKIGIKEKTKFFIKKYLKLSFANISEKFKLYDFAVKAEVKKFSKQILEGQNCFYVFSRKDKWAVIEQMINNLLEQSNQQEKPKINYIGRNDNKDNSQNRKASEDTKQSSSESQIYLSSDTQQEQVEDLSSRKTYQKLLAQKYM